MKEKFIAVCALVGAMASFGLNPALSAPVAEPTNLVDLLKSGSQDQTSKAKKAAPSAKRVSIIINRQSPMSKGAKGAKPGGSYSRSAKGGNAYSQIINRYAATYGISSTFAHAVVRHESNFQPNVRGKAGEIGLMQIKLSTARAMGYSGSAKGLYNPSTNIQYGMKYLAMAQKLGGGSTCGTILKYNAGHGATRMNPTSAKYCSSVKAYMRSF